MAIELVTGFTGAAHIDSLDIAKFNAAVVGKGDYVMEGVGDKALKATMTTANKVHIESGNGLMQGRHFIVDSAGLDLTVQTGTQGQKRNDLVVARYTKNATTGIEGISLVVIKGTPTTGTPADPAYTKSDILNGNALTADMPLWRIPLNGIAVGSPVPLFKVFKAGADAWDSLSRTEWVALDVRPDKIDLNASMRAGCVHISCVILNNWWPIQHTWAHIGTMPAHMRPAKPVYGTLSGDGGGGTVNVAPDGKIYVSAHYGVTVNGWAFSISFPVG